MSEKPFTLADYGINQAGVVAVQDALGTYVTKCFNDAVLHRRSMGIDARMLRNLRANKCEYQPDEIALLGPYNDVYMGISALKARAAASWLTDIVLNNIDKPWTLDPTPSPELRETQIETVIDDLIRELPDLATVEALEERARELKEAYTTLSKVKAERASKRMEVLIEDQMAQGDWMTTFAGVIDDITVYPTTFVRGPYVIGRVVGIWDGEEYTAQTEQMPITRTISPFDAYPSSDSDNAQNGEYFIEKQRFNQAGLYALIGVNGFNSGNIRQAIHQYANGYSLNLIGDAERERLEDKSPTGVSIMTTPTNIYETLIYNGRIRGDMLADHGIVVKDKQASYECEVWQVGDIVIRAILNPNPTGARPIYSTSYRKVKGSIWGQSVICLTYDVNRICNAAARNLVKNMGYSAGPIGEVVGERVADTQDPTDIAPYRIVLVGPDLTGTGAPAYKFHNVQSIATDLMNVFDKHMKYADDLSGVPSYVLGNPQVAGAGRTLGGLSMLMGNAAKGIKNVQLNIDRDIIGPVVTGYFVYNMKTSKDDSIKADAKVVAKGATGLLQRELAQTRTVELLQLLTPYIENWDNLPNGIKVLLREVLKTTGLPIDDIIADPKQVENQNDIRNLLGAGGGDNVPTSGEQLPPGPQSVSMERGLTGAPPLPPQSIPQLQAPVPINLPQGA